MDKQWTESAIFYHIYPLGFCGTPQFSHEEDDIQHRILKLTDWIDHFKEMHVNALYLGPVFASYEHGYDTSDYRILDRRLGSNEDFQKVCDALHDAGIRIVLDGVFHHVGREFWAFTDVLENKEQSAYKDWFSHIDFSRTSPYGDPFSYEAWEGHYNLVKLNLQNEATVQYLLDSVGMWMDEFHIDGLRLDAADRIDHSFFRRLHTYTKERRQDFWLMGEIIHGNYCVWANPDMLDSVTNYECYKGYYSSHNTKNYFEIAYSLNRQYGNGGIYKDIRLYNFADNHDVNRLASTLTCQEDLYNVYTLLYTMPGVPSVYYGSEYGITGIKHDGSDADIRPELSLQQLDQNNALYRHICKLGKIRSEHEVFSNGSYEQIEVRNEQLLYRRQNEAETIYVAYNLADKAARFTIKNETQVNDLLHDECILAKGQELIVTIQPHDSAVYLVTKELRNEPSETRKEAKVKQPEMIQETKPSFTKEICRATVKLGKYRHFKGKEYALLYIAHHSETKEDMAVYRQLYGDGDVWVRPLQMFMEEVECEGIKVPRFTYIGK